MSRSTLGLPEDLQQYIFDHAVRETEIQRKVREETAEHPSSQMQIAPEQAQMMFVLAKTVNARLALEIGVFTGYSALAVAQALPPDGRLIACEINEEFAETARGYWKEAGVDRKIELRIGPATATLDALISDGYTNAFDFVFIDADKTSYPEYYERCIALLRPGGLVLVDNVFRGGEVTDESSDDDAVQATRQLNERVSSDKRVDACIVPMADGITIARKR